MIYFLDRLAEFDTGGQGCDSHLHKISADGYVVYILSIVFVASLRVFMKMLHLHGMLSHIFLFVSRCQLTPWKSLDCNVGLAGVGWSVGSKN